MLVLRIALAVLLVSASSLELAYAAAPAKPDQCFRSIDYQDFRAINDHSFYIRTQINTVFRIDLAAPCTELTYPDAHLITVIRGSDYICDALDWDLKVGEEPPSIPEACIVSKQTRLTPAEAAAIPPKLRP